MWLMFMLKEDNFMELLQNTGPVYITRLDAGALYEHFHVEQNNPAKAKETENLI